MNDEKQKNTAHRRQNEEFQAHLHEQYTDNEKEYHAAYPNTPAPWTMGFLTGVFSRYGRGMLLWALVGAAAAVVMWIVFAMYYYRAY